MSITIEQAQANLDALLAASASGLLSVRLGERTVTYRSMSELVQAIGLWKSQLAELRRVAAGASRHGFGVASFGSGR